MQDPDSYPLFPPERANDLAEELYPDIFSDAFPDIDPGPATYSEFYARRSALRPAVRAGKQPARAERSTTGSVKAVQKTPGTAPLSLVDALQATLNRNRPKKGRVVISAEKNDRDTIDYLSSMRPEYSLSPRLRLLLLFIVIVLIVLFMLFFPVRLSIGRETFPTQLAVID
jgi:hypothetical protein